MVGRGRVLPYTRPHLKSGSRPDEAPSEIALKVIDGHTAGTIPAPNRIELCYMDATPEAQVASCTELTKKT